ncbi:2-dehydro-3-deoxygalactonokinase [Roseibium aestuarii]|uniref:2-dehydro-3-deoxygalactonokinase n=1 Tax=Roseibium aestuarii TaxID=2600299 RepID=UPI003A981E27
MMSSDPTQALTRSAPAGSAVIPGAISWIAVDWGTSRLRVFAMDANDRPIASASSDKGMGQLSRDAFEEALAELVSGWLADGPRPMIACGMVGARQGWIEAAYGPVPGPALSETGLVRAPATDPALALRILPGLAQQEPADVMRGEETQIAGFLSAHPGFDGLLCLPGTHSKWARLKDDQVLSFRTYMTGEMFALLSGHSVLRHSLAAAADMSETSGSRFVEGLDRARALRGNLSADLFSIRARGLLQGFTPVEAFDYLSGLLLGAELTAAAETDADLPVALIGSGPLGARYRQALGHFGRDAAMMDTTDATLAGLTAACHTLKEAGEWPAI